MLIDSNISAKILGSGSYAPTKVLTNEEIERKVLGTNAKWTKNNLGIEQRHIAGQDESTGDLAVKAAQMALKSANISPLEIDLIILGTATPRRIAPSTACYVQYHIGAVNSAAFDLSAVCSGFVYGLSVGYQFIISGTYQNILVIGADTFSKITDWSRRDCVFFGDGAGAVILSRCPKGKGILAFDIGADGSEENAWTVYAGGSEMPATLDTIQNKLHYWYMDGKAVYSMGTKRIPETINKSLKIANLCIDDVDHVIPHQPSIGMLQKSAELSGIPFEKFHTNMDRYANTSAATIPIMLDEAIKAGSLKPDDIVVFASVGAGWTWGSMVVRWFT